MSSTVGINLLWMVAGNVGGTEEYATRLLAPFASLPEFSIEMYGLRGLRHAHPELVPVGPIHEAPVTGIHRAVRVGAERSWLPQRSRRAALVHHFGGTVPAGPGASQRLLLTIHDLLPLDDPSMFSAPKAKWLARQIPASIARADRVMTPSAYVASQIVDRFDITTDRVHVVPSSHSARGAERAPSNRTTCDSGAALAKLGVRSPYVLYPAISYRHKNHRVLIDAIASMTRPDVQLVFTGRADVAQPAIEEMIAARSLHDRVRVLGRVPNPAFSTLFANARVLVFPSRFEGFGLPLIEAMAAGIPIVAARATAVPEVVGDAGVLVDPDDVDAWVAAIERVLGDDGLRADLVRRGQTRAEDFAPMPCAERLAAVYRMALGESR